jgi:hypothetical protein
MVTDYVNIVLHCESRLNEWIDLSHVPTFT